MTSDQRPALLRIDQTGIVYALLDPGTRRPVYIGSTVMYPKQRLSIHLRDATLGKGRPVNVWLRGLLAAGLRPDLCVLETCAADDLAAREQIWIDRLRAYGRDLLNRHRAGRGQKRRPALEAALWRLQRLKK